VEVGIEAGVGEKDGDEKDSGISFLMGRGGGGRDSGGSTCAFDDEETDGELSCETVGRAGSGGFAVGGGGAGARWLMFQNSRGDQL
jgi:hypothetical protein